MDSAEFPQPPALDINPITGRPTKDALLDANARLHERVTDLTADDIRDRHAILSLWARLGYETDVDHLEALAKKALEEAEMDDGIDGEALKVASEELIALMRILAEAHTANNLINNDTRLQRDAYTQAEAEIDERRVDSELRTGGVYDRNARRIEAEFRAEVRERLLAHHRAQLESELSEPGSYELIVAEELRRLKASGDYSRIRAEILADKAPTIDEDVKDLIRRQVQDEIRRGSGELFERARQTWLDSAEGRTFLAREYGERDDSLSPGSTDQAPAWDRLSKEYIECVLLPEFLGRGIDMQAVPAGMAVTIMLSDRTLDEQLRSSREQSTLNVAQIVNLQSFGDGSFLVIHDTRSTEPYMRGTALKYGNTITIGKMKTTRQGDEKFVRRVGADSPLAYMVDDVISVTDYVVVDLQINGEGVRGDTKDYDWI